MIGEPLNAKPMTSLSPILSSRHLLPRLYPDLFLPVFFGFDVG